MLNSIVGMLGNGGGGGGSFESIATIAASGSSITFSSIPSTYKHLQIRWIANAPSGSAPYMRFNSDSSSVYTNHSLDGDGSSVYAQGQANANNALFNMWGIASTANCFAGGIIDIVDYADTSKYKTVKSFAGYDQNGSGAVSLASNLWRSASAISSITITLPSPTSGTSYALYGIKG